MRRISAKRIRRAVADLCVRANTILRPDILSAIKDASGKERNKRAQEMLKLLIENAAAAKEKKLAVCQDTGMAVVFLRIGQDLHITGGSLFDAVTEGVRRGYREGSLRKSIVNDPFLRKNTKTNTPCVIHSDIVRGSRLRITVVPKGFGSENKSALKMFNPTERQDAIERFVIETVKRAGPDACPPFVVGVGIGGTFEGAALLAKKALTRPVDTRNKRPHVARLEKTLLRKVNALNIGPMGLGGTTSALGVNVEVAPTHIAGLPVAVNMSCHATRGAETVL